MQIRHSIYICCLGMFLIGCATQKKTTTASDAGGKYSEDLSVWRPKVEGAVSDTNSPTGQDGRKQTAFVEPKYAVNKKLDAVLDSIDHFNLQRNFIDGFTIQVYSGPKRDVALNAKKELTSTFSDLQSEVQYAQPNFRVKIGKYFNRIDAQKDYVDIKRHFPTAIIIPDKVPIN